MARRFNTRLFPVIPPGCADEHESKMRRINLTDSFPKNDLQFLAAIFHDFVSCGG